MNINEILLFWLKILFSERRKMINEMDIYGFDIARP